MTQKDTTCDNFIGFVKDIFSSELAGNIPLHAPTVGNIEITYVEAVLQSTFVSTVGDYVDRFAQSLSQYTDNSFILPVVSGTAGLHLALLSVGVSPGTLVLTQSLSFVATANAVKYCGADPVFLDVEPSTYGMDPEKLKIYLEENCEIRDDGKAWSKTNGKQVAACLPVHIFGNPCQIFELKMICDNWGIPLVEDSAESLGSLEHGIHTGTIGDVGVYSFNGNKIITTGAGGAVVSRNEAIISRVAHLANVCKVSVPNSFDFKHDDLGYNYKMPAVNAALGLGQLENLTKKIKAKKSIHEAYGAWFANSEIEFVVPRPSSDSNYWLNAIKFESRSERDYWLEKTNKMGVSTRPLWRPINEYPQFRGCEATSLKVTELLSQLVMNIPSSPGV